VRYGVRLRLLRFHRQKVYLQEPLKQHYERHQGDERRGSTLRDIGGQCSRYLGANRMAKTSPVLEKDPNTGRFLPGNSGFGGRRKGSRNTLNEMFLRDLQEAWRKRAKRS
jgi:hypothetical protein